MKLIRLGMIAVMIHYAPTAPGADGKWAAKTREALNDTGDFTAPTPRRILVFHGCAGFAHHSIPGINEVLAAMGDVTGAFTTDFSEDMSVFTADNLARYDAILFNNSTRLTFDDAQKTALMGFVKGGRGFIGIHGATDNFYKWDEAGEMIGGYFNQHPWSANGTWAIKVDEPDHPLVAAFGGQGIKLKEEMYRFRAPYSRARLRVLMSLDLTDEATRSVETGRLDRDYAVSWIRQFGEGRVFFCSIGHNMESVTHPAVLKHYLAGIRYALGDLEADDHPSHTLDQEAQGEYTGQMLIDGALTNAHAQIIAQGDGQFHARILTGLDGRAVQLFEMSGQRQDSEVLFKNADGKNARLEIFNQFMKGSDKLQLRKSRRLPSPDLGAPPPEGATVLLGPDTTDLNLDWKGWPDKPASWKLLPGGIIEVKGGSIISRSEFGDSTIHLEFMIPFLPERAGQERGNSGVYVQGRYEVQILDSFGLPVTDRECGAIYEIAGPAINMCYPPGEWQSYDIDFTAARLDGEKILSPARMTVRHNGVVVHDDIEIHHTTSAAPYPKPGTIGGLYLQDHASPVRYRNIWIQPRKN